MSKYNPSADKDVKPESLSEFFVGYRANGVTDGMVIEAKGAKEALGVVANVLGEKFELLDVKKI